MQKLILVASFSEHRVSDTFIDVNGECAKFVQKKKRRKKCDQVEQQLSGSQFNYAKHVSFQIVMSHEDASNAIK